MEKIYKSNKRETIKKLYLEERGYVKALLEENKDNEEVTNYLVKRWNDFGRRYCPSIHVDLRKDFIYDPNTFEFKNPDGNFLEGIYNYRADYEDITILQKMLKGIDYLHYEFYRVFTKDERQIKRAHDKFNKLTDNEKILRYMTLKDFKEKVYNYIDNIVEASLNILYDRLSTVKDIKRYVYDNNDVEDYYIKEALNSMDLYIEILTRNINTVTENHTSKGYYKRLDEILTYYEIFNKHSALALGYPYEVEKEGYYNILSDEKLALSVDRFMDDYLDDEKMENLLKFLDTLCIDVNHILRRHQ